MNDQLQADDAGPTEFLLPVAAPSDAPSPAPVPTPLPALAAAPDRSDDYTGEFLLPAAPAPAANPAPDDGCPQPLVRQREEHGISRRDIDQDALKVLYRLARNGFTAYLVGGGVRDLLLGRRPKDFDISTDAKPEEIRALFKNCILIGRRFRLAHIRYGDKIIETSTFRRAPELCGDPADPDADLFQRDDNLFGTPEEDALRRDFTVNGLFYDIDNFSVIDYVGGMDDLLARRIRAIGDPCIRFREDPVRMVRAIRFASRLDFDFEPNTLDAIRRHRDELVKASPPRLLEEITRLFAFASGEKAVGLLHATGLLRVILPELADCLEDPKTDTNCFWPRLRALDAGDTVLPDATPAVIFAVLLADPFQAWLSRRGGGSYHRLRFDRVRSFLEPIAIRLRFPRKLTDRIVNIYMSRYRFANPGGKRSARTGFVSEEWLSDFVTQDWFHEALAVEEINVTAEGGSQTRLSSWRELLAERIYGREDEPGGSRRGHHNGNNTHANAASAPGQPARNGGAEALSAEGQPAVPVSGEAGAVGDLPPGVKLSRSARRRRNKRRNRQLRDNERFVQPNGQGAPQDEDGASSVVEPAVASESVAAQPRLTVTIAAPSVQVQAVGPAAAAAAVAGALDKPAAAAPSQRPVVQAREPALPASASAPIQVTACVPPPAASVSAPAPAQPVGVAGSASPVPAPAQAAQAAQPSAQGESGGGNGGGANGVGETRKSGRHRNRRERGRKKKEALAESSEHPPVQSSISSPSPQSVVVPEMQEEVKPLTAAVFYTPRPEPEPAEGKGKGKGRGGRGRKSGKQGAQADGNGKDGSSSAKQTPPDPMDRKPLPMDRSEEAEIPMHWLDEI